MPQAQYDKVCAVLQTVMESTSQSLGETSGFVQRESKVTAARFVQMMVLACLGRVDASLGDMVEVGADLGVEVSAAGLDQRIDGEAVHLLQGVLQALVAQSRAATAVEGDVLQQFSAVYIEDSTYLSLPEQMAVRWRGSGGSASAAGAKVWMVYEYRTGTLHALEVISGCCPDQACPLPVRTAAPGCLYLFDLGFFSLKRLQRIADQQDFFVCRLQPQTALYTRDGRRLDLMKLLQGVHQQAEFEVLLGAPTRLPVRLLCQRLPKDAVARRRKRVHAEARRMRRQLSSDKQRLLPWNLFCTNLPAAVWALPQVLTTYRLRWQIELLFKLAKSQAGLDRFGPWRTERILCQLYARLIALVIAHWLLAPLRFHTPRELSMPKALRILQRMTPLLAHIIAEGWSNFHTFWQRLVARCHHHALKDKRRRKPSTYSRLAAMYA